MTDDRVDKVARAISGKCYACLDGSEDCGDWEEMSDRAKVVYEDAARAALSALDPELARLREALVNANMALEFWDREAEVVIDC